MRTRVLEIIRFSPDGAVLRKIRCLSGRVTVLRSQSPQELLRYRNALRGVHQEERFEIVLDGDPYDPRGHVLIDANAVTPPPMRRHTSVRQYLSEGSLDWSKGIAWLTALRYSAIVDRQLAELDGATYRVVEMLRALLTHGTSLILDEPFEDLPADGREPLAQLLVDGVKDSDRFVIVTRMSYRPECWIEHELVSRALLERPRQPTIGYGASATAGEEGLGGKAGRSNAKLVEPAPVYPRHPAQERVAVWLGVLGILLGSLVAYVWQLGAYDLPREKFPLEVMGSARNDPWGGENRALARTADVALITDRVADPKVRSPQSGQDRGVLAVFPDDIQDAVKKAFFHPEEALKVRAELPSESSKTGREATIPEQQRSMATSLAGPGMFSYEAMPGAEVNGLPPEDMEARREEIRRRFLEAIARSRQ